jgi:predicted ATPase
MRDTASIHALAHESLLLARAERYAFWEPVVMVFDGWAMTTDGNQEAGIAMIREGLSRYRAAGNGVAQVRMIAVLAEAAWGLGLCDEAFELLADGMGIATSTGEAFFEPELYRVRGEFLRQRGELPAARASIVEALTLARAQGAIGLELRAAMSLFSLESAVGAADVERASLAEVLGRFTEGFDTTDLQDARRLLGIAR